MVTRERGLPDDINAIEIAFDDERLGADAGLVLPGTLADRLGAQQVIDGLVDRPQDPVIGDKALSVAFAMLAGRLDR